MSIERTPIVHADWLFVFHTSHAVDGCCLCGRVTFVQHAQLEVAPPTFRLVWLLLFVLRGGVATYCVALCKLYAFLSSPAFYSFVLDLAIATTPHELRHVITKD